MIKASADQGVAEKCIDKFAKVVTNKNLTPEQAWSAGEVSLLPLLPQKETDHSR